MSPAVILLNQFWRGSEVVMRVIFTRLLIFSLLGMVTLSTINLLSAQQIDLNQYSSKSFVSAASPINNIKPNEYGINDYGLYTNSSVIVQNYSLTGGAPIDFNLGGVNSKKKKKVNYQAIVGGAIGFAVGFALGASMDNGDSAVPIGGLILAIPGTVIGVKLTSGNGGKSKRTN